MACQECTGCNLPCGTCWHSAAFVLDPAPATCKHYGRVLWQPGHQFACQAWTQLQYPSMHVPTLPACPTCCSATHACQVPTTRRCRWRHVEVLLHACSGPLGRDSTIGGWQPRRAWWRTCAWQQQGAYLHSLPNTHVASGGWPCADNRCIRPLQGSTCHESLQAHSRAFMSSIMLVAVSAHWPLSESPCCQLAASQHKETIVLPGSL